MHEAEAQNLETMRLLLNVFTKIYFFPCVAMNDVQQTNKLQ